MTPLLAPLATSDNRGLTIALFLAVVDRAAKREAANQEARQLEQDYATSHGVETYGDTPPEDVEVVKSETAWQNLEDHLTEHRPLLNDLPEWRANYAEIDAERFRHIRQRGDEDRGWER